MGVKVHKPTTNGRRRSSGDDFSDITKKTPEKSLTKTLKRHAGRNNQGKITVRHRGGGVKRRYRVVDFKMDRMEPAEVVAIEYDPYRSARIALIEYTDGNKAYILAADGLEVGATVESTEGTTDLNPSNRMPLGNMPSGTPVHNLEYYPGKGGTIIRSAGAAATVVSQDDEWVNVKMPSGEIRRFSVNCRASVGKVSNPDWRNIRWGKAGRMRYRGFRPTVRGKAMNPVDHPHGGGEGAQSIGMKHPKTPQGKPALGVKTRKPKKASDKYIVSRRKNKRKGKR